MLGDTPGGRGAAIAGALFRARFFVLAGALVVTGAALYPLLSAGQGYFSIFARSLAPPIVVWACGVYALMLSARLALVAVIAPLLAWLWWIVIAGAFDFWPGAYDVFAALSLSIVAVGALVAALQMHVMAIALARGKDMTAAMRAAYARSILPCVLALLAACAGIVALAYPDFSILPSIGIGAVLTLIACFLLPPLAASLLPINENFIARTNRVREERERLLSFFAIFSIPRWAFAIIGIAAVVSTILCFDAAFAPLWNDMKLKGAAASAAIGLLGAIGLRDWRYFFSCGAAALLATLMGGWTALRLGADPGYAGDAALLVGCGAGAALIYFLAGPLAAYRRSGEPMMIACSRALDESGPVVFVLGIALALALLVGAIANDVSPGISVLPFFYIIGALVLFPAITAALDDLFPRRRQLKELYRAR